MQIQPITNKPEPTFGNKIYQFTKAMTYGRCIHGSNRGLDYDVYVSIDNRTGNIEHKLYYISKNNKWVKSILRFFSGNKVYKELRSQAK